MCAPRFFKLLNRANRVAQTLQVFPKREVRGAQMQAVVCLCNIDGLLPPATRAVQLTQQVVPCDE